MTSATDQVRLPTEHGEFMVSLWPDAAGAEHVALVRGQVAGQCDVPVRIHSECLTGDIFGSLRCDCGAQLDAALKRLGQEPNGILLYMRQEGRGIGLRDKLRAYVLQDHGHDTVSANEFLGYEADQRDYAFAANILHQLGVRSIHLITNNPAKTEGLAANGIRVTEVRDLLPEVTAENERYLLTKRDRMRHTFDLGGH